MVFARGAESTVFPEDSWGWHTEYGFANLVIGGRNRPKTQVKGRILATLAKIPHRYGLSERLRSAATPPDRPCESATAPVNNPCHNRLANVLP
jgi:hypothetical protein